MFYGSFSARGMLLVVYILLYVAISRSADQTYEFRPNYQSRWIKDTDDGKENNGLKSKKDTTNDGFRADE